MIEHEGERHELPIEDITVPHDDDPRLVNRDLALGKLETRRKAAAKKVLEARTHRRRLYVELIKIGNRVVQEDSKKPNK